LARGEKLDNLVDRSNALSAQSKMFYKTAKKVRLRFSRSMRYLAQLLIRLRRNIAKLVLRDHVGLQYTLDLRE
jgi:hypothetical protein